jgi:D-3-phosphoglycerate dehydrogenase / 2-oxoglutarate reductase
MTKTVLLDSTLHPEGLSVLNEAGFEVVGPFSQDTPERRKLFARAQAIIISSLWEISADVLAQSPTLQAVGRPGIGIDNVDVDAATRQRVCVVHTPDAPTQSTAEHAIALMLALAKGIVRSDRNFRARGWDSKNDFVGVELKGKTLGLVGLGRIGGTFARAAREGFGMRVLVFDPYINATRAPELGCERHESLAQMLAECDFVSLHCALTPQTRGLIGRAELQAMKPGAFLINCSRGPVVDEPALVDALRANVIAGAGLDVFSPEPPEADNPLLAMENVIVTPHVASHTEDGVRAMGVGVAEEVRAVLNGERPRWLANPEVWPKRRTDDEG